MVAFQKLSLIDTRDGVGVVSSRIGMKREAVAIEDDALSLLFIIMGHLQDLNGFPRVHGPIFII